MDAHPRLLDQVRTRLRLLHHSYRTEQACTLWIRHYILFHGKRHPAGMGAREPEAFLSHLAVDRKVSASTQSQALFVLLFLYRQVLEVELPWLDGVVRDGKGARVRVRPPPARPQVTRALRFTAMAVWIYYQSTT